MGYNIEDVSGNSTGGPDQFTFTLDLTVPGASTVTGDFDEVPLFGGGGGEAPGGYSFSALSDPTLGSLAADPVTGQFTFTVDRAAVMATGADQTVSFTVTGFGGGGQSDTDTVFINILICVARGTLFDTPAGPRPVERLTTGDAVLTADGRCERILWIGSRRLDAQDLAEAPELRPVRIAAGAFGDGLPRRPLLVSPQHHILVDGWIAQLVTGKDGVLVPAQGLVDGKDIRRILPREGVEYFHILLPRHEVILTEGLPTESFYPGAYALAGLTMAARTSLFQAVPGLAFDPASYGPPARPVASRDEARLIARRLRRTRRIWGRIAA